ncbi:MAG: transglutaminase-like cysteine peptidase [Azospirillaceae bacterium]
MRPRVPTPTDSPALAGAARVRRRRAAIVADDARTRLIGLVVLGLAAAAAALAGPSALSLSQARAQQITMAYVPAPPPERRGPVEVGAPEQLAKWRDLAPAVARAVAAGGSAAARLPSVDEVRAIDARIDRVPYIEDSALWGERDRWVDPDTFYRTGGDCEDFAIAKYVELRRAGVPADRLRIVVGYDRGLGDYHAFLTVALAGESFVLDVPGMPMVPVADRQGFEPIYALNEEALWRFR